MAVRNMANLGKSEKHQIPRFNIHELFQFSLMLTVIVCNN